MDKLFCTSCQADKPIDGFVKGKSGRSICRSCKDRIEKMNGAAHRSKIKVATKTLKENPDRYIDSILKRCFKGDLE